MPDGGVSKVWEAHGGKYPRQQAACGGDLSETRRRWAGSRQGSKSSLRDMTSEKPLTLRVPLLLLHRTGMMRPRSPANLGVRSVQIRPDGQGLLCKNTELHSEIGMHRRKNKQQKNTKKNLFEKLQMFYYRERKK